MTRVPAWLQGLRARDIGLIVIIAAMVAIGVITAHSPSGGWQ